MLSKIPTRILIIDNNQVQNELYSKLKNKGYEAIVVSNSDEGIKTIKENKFGVIIINTKIVDKKTISVMRKIKEMDSRIERVVICKNTKDAKMEYFDRIINKSMNVEDVVVIIEKTLEKYQLKEMVAMYERTMDVFSTLEFNELPKVIIDSTVEELRADDASLMLFDDNKKQLYIVDSNGLSKEIISATKMSVGEGISGYVVKNRRPLLLIDGLENDPRFKHIKQKGVQRKNPITSSIVVPLIKNNKVLGILNINRRNIIEHFTEHDLHKANTAASLISVAIENAKMHSHIKKTGEQELLKVHDELQEASEKIRQMQVQLIREEKFSLLHKLTSSLVHQLRTPLSIIDLSAQFLKKEIQGSEKIISTLNTIQRNIQRASDILQDMFEMVLIKAETMKFERCRIGEILEKAIEIMQPKLNGAGVNVRMKCAKEELQYININKHYLEHVVVNLISNSIDAMSEGGEINIDLSVDPKSEKIVMTFVDTGKGVKEEHLKELFTPFFTTKEKGIGLGLFTVLQIIEAHRGDIKVKSELNVGTTFIISLPIK
ncbi:MAG: ATP-binding protein [Candidatus Firestonebacteria bacterium]